MSSDNGVGVTSVVLPFRKPEVCTGCGEVIEDRVAVFSGAGRGSVFHESCFGHLEPVAEESGHDR